ncbi:MAG: DNA polymerase III subunit delta' [Deltaproteobacteria bacterium]|nr:DNA polymerase III subunit delta' [Deltaproteobacteria bacterium]
MPQFESFIDQKRPNQILSAFLRKGNIPHALLFYGPPGVGKRTTAMLFAKACNCLHRTSEAGYRIPCGDCRSCRKIASENHPDVIYIRPAGAVIRITQIRELSATLSLKPYEAKTRVVIIADAHSMNTEAGNALLKVLEEPPDHTIIILTTDQPLDLLPTVLSRCQQIRFKPLAMNTVKNLLIDKQKVEPETAQIIATMANGSFSRAMEMSKSNWIKRRRWLLAEMRTVAQKPVGSILALAESLSKDRGFLPDAFDIINTWFRDLLVYKWSPQKIVNKDLTDSVRYDSQRLSAASLYLKIKFVQNAQKDILRNANVRLTLESLMVRLSHD